MEPESKPQPQQEPPEKQANIVDMNAYRDTPLKEVSSQQFKEAMERIGKPCSF